MARINGLFRVAVDAMGGDKAPASVVEGAVMAARKEGVQVLLVGDPEIIRAELAKHDVAGLPVGAVPSEGLIEEGEPPATALRQKPKASVIVATGLVKEGHADACVTMGSTGAAMASAALVLGVTEGVDRPVLGGPIIGVAPRTVLIDIGTNVDCRPSQLVNFAAIGSVFARQFWDVESPRVAILSVGAEAGKGNRQVREASELLAKSGLNFIGNVEGNDIPRGAAEVVVCDGFVGNVVMKLTEGLGNALSNHIRESLKGRLPEADVESLAREVYEMNNTVEALGGGPLFGVNGVSVVGHGKADAGAVYRAIGTARMAVEGKFIEKLNEELAQVRARVGE